jgi:hypothetical protein
LDRFSLLTLHPLSFSPSLFHVDDAVSRFHPLL